MNENIDLTKILKNCPKGTKLYSLVHGEVEFQCIKSDSMYPIVIKLENGDIKSIASDGKIFNGYNGECIIFPSKDQKDWSKFTAPWFKKERFDPKTLKPFDKVIVADSDHYDWKCDLFSHIVEYGHYSYRCIGNVYKHCIPYNDDTKHLVGTTEEAPEYYRYWEE